MQQPTANGRKWANIATSIGWAGVLLWALLTQSLPVTSATFAQNATLPAHDPISTQAVSTDVTATVAFQQAQYVVGEGAGSLEMRLDIVPPAPHPITITVSTSGINATAPADYLALRQLNVIPTGAAALTVTIGIVDDGQVEGAEQFLITLSNLDGASTGVFTQSEVVIEDNDVAYLGITPVQVDERAGSVTLVITQSPTSTLESLVDYQTIDGSAVAPDDYLAAFGTASIPPGSTQTSITVTIVNDAEVDPEESFAVRLLDPLNATLAQSTTTVSILDDDGLPRLRISDTAAYEAEGIMAFPVTLDMSWPNTVTVDYATGDGAAQPSVDYLMTGGTLVLPAGATTGAITVQLINDFVPEPEESIVMLLVAPVQAQLVVTQAEGIILDSAYARVYLPALMD